MKRSLWLLMLFLLAGHVPAASADSACEGRFVNPITDICWSCIFPLSLGSIKVSQGKVPDTANPSMPIQICPAPPPAVQAYRAGHWLLGADGADGRHPVTGMHGEPGLQPAGFW